MPVKKGGRLKSGGRIDSSSKEGSVFETRLTKIKISYLGSHLMVAMRGKECLNEGWVNEQAKWKEGRYQASVVACLGVRRS